MKKIEQLMFICLTVMLTSCLSCNKPDDGSGSGQSPVEESYTTDVEYYQFSPLVKESQVYAVKAAGKYITVIPTIEPHLGWIGVDEGKVKFEISLQSGRVEEAVVRPVAKNHEYRVENGRLVVILEKYDRVSVEINGDITNPLFLFVNPIDKERPSKDDPSVKYYEAGKIYDEGHVVLTEDCKEVYFEPGTYVKGSILANDLEGVRIHGGGFLNSEGYPGRYSEFYQPFSIALNRCPNSRLDDYTHLFMDGGWGTLYTNCSGSYITNVKTICTNSAPGVKTNNDSMDIIGGKDVHVKYGFLYGHDDCYCLKSQKFHLKGDVDGIYYEECIGWNVDAGNTFEIGYETQIDVKNVHYKNIYAIHPGTGTNGKEMRRSPFSIHNGGAGTISNVTYENAYAEDVIEFCLYVACLKHSYNMGYDENGNQIEYSPGHIDGVTYNNLNIISVRPYAGKAVISGFNADHKVSNLTFNNFTYLGEKVTEKPSWMTTSNTSNIKFN